MDGAMISISAAQPDASMQLTRIDYGTLNGVVCLFSVYSKAFTGTHFTYLDHRGQVPPEFGAGDSLPRFCHVAKF